MRHRINIALTPLRLLIAGACFASACILLTVFVHPAPPADSYDATRGFLLGLGLTLIALAGIRHYLAKQG